MLAESCPLEATSRTTRRRPGVAGPILARVEFKRKNVAVCFTQAAVFLPVLLPEPPSRLSGPRFAGLRVRVAIRRRPRQVFARPPRLLAVEGTH